MTLALKLTDREDSNDAIDGDTHDAFTFLDSSAADDLNANVDGRLLTKPNDLGASTPIPAHKSLVSARGDKISGGKCDCADTIEMPSKLLERGEGQR